MLEETGLPYEPHLVIIAENESWTPEFLSLNPNGKIPAVIDPNGPEGKPLALFESGAILTYLADKTGTLLPGGARRYETLQWVFWQVGHVGPFFGQVGFFHKFAGSKWEDKRPLQRFVDESKRLLGVLDDRLAGREWVMDDYSIADIALLGWVRNLIGFYEARELVEYRCAQERAGMARAGTCAPGGPARAADPVERTDQAKLKLIERRSPRPLPGSTSWRSQLSQSSSRPGRGWTATNG